MSNKEPSLGINMSNGRRIELTPQNSMLYTFLGETAIGETTIDNASVNHAWVTTGKNEQGQATGIYFFAEFDDAYKAIARHMTDHRYPMLLNQREVPEGDLAAWQARADAAVAEFAQKLPDEL